MNVDRAAAHGPTATDPFTGRPVHSMNPRLISIVLAIIGAHALALWALQSGLMRPPAREQVVHVALAAQLIEAPQPETASATLASAAPTLPAPTPVAAPPTPARPSRPAQPAQQTVAAPPQTDIAAEPAQPSATAIDPTPVPAVAEAASSAAPVTPVVPATGKQAGTAALAAHAPPAAPPQLELPSSEANYLNNPRPPYPALSKRLREQGKVVIRAYIEVNGTAEQATIAQSSGYDRLDQVALHTVLKWRYAPGKRAGQPEAMWFHIPITFVLD